MSHKIKLGIVIPTFNRLEYLSSVLEELHQQIPAVSHQIEVEVAVINDASSDGTTEYLRLQPAYIHTVEGDGSLWFTRSINKGAFYILEKLSPDYLLILNDDVIIGDNYIKKVSEYLANNPIAAKSVIGPLNVTYERPYRVIFSGIKHINIFGKREKYYSSFTEYNAEKFTGIKPSKVLPGRGMLFPVKIFVALGGLDKSLYQYHSDEDFCLRAIKKGFGVFVNWDWTLFSNHTMTSAVTSYNKVPLNKVFKSFLNKYSRNYIPDRALMVWRHHPKLLFPILVFLNYFLIIRSFLITRK